MGCKRNLRICKACKRKFVPGKFHRYQTTCSRKCSKKAEYEKHKDEYIARARNWRRRNPGKNTVYQRNWRHRNVARVRLWRRVNMQRRLAKIRMVDEGNVTSAAFLALCACQGFMCWWCAERKPLGIDHIIPIARGGKHGLDNIIASCYLCNSIKKDRLWPLYLGKLPKRIFTGAGQ
jgi:5-methylcytosine-specific restriction endonuclease McrA